MREGWLTTTFDDLDGDVDVVFPASPVDVSEVSAAQLLLQGELFFRELPLIHCEMAQIWCVGLFLMEETHRFWRYTVCAYIYI